MIREIIGRFIPPSAPASPSPLGHAWTLPKGAREAMTSRLRCSPPPMDASYPLPLPGSAISSVHVDKFKNVADHTKHPSVVAPGRARRLSNTEADGVQRVLVREASKGTSALAEGGPGRSIACLKRLPALSRTCGMAPEPASPRRGRAGARAKKMMRYRAHAPNGLVTSTPSNALLV